MFEGILQKFLAAQGMASTLYSYRQHNVMLDDSITSVEEHLSREFFTRAPDSREYPLKFVPNRQKTEILVQKRGFFSMSEKGGTKLNLHIIFGTKSGWPLYSLFLLCTP